MYQRNLFTGFHHWIYQNEHEADISFNAIIV